MRHFTLFLSLLILAAFAGAQSEIEQVYYLDLDGVIVKITLKGNPKVMEKVYKKEIKVCQELIGIHRDIEQIQKRISNIAREFGVQCPFLQKIAKERAAWNQQALKKHQEHLVYLKKLHDKLGAYPRTKSKGEEFDGAPESCEESAALDEFDGAPTEVK